MSNFYLLRGKDSEQDSVISASSNPVIKLLKDPKYHNRNHICYVDNYFNGENLCKKQLDVAINCCGSFRTNRLKSTECVNNLQSHDIMGNQKSFLEELIQQMIKKDISVVSTLIFLSMELIVPEYVPRSIVAGIIIQAPSVAYYPFHAPKSKQIDKNACHRCRFPHCKKETSIWCLECKIPLCLTTVNNSNHFTDFHMKLQQP
jgi:hypothetical protein